MEWLYKPEKDEWYRDVHNCASRVYGQSLSFEQMRLRWLRKREIRWGGMKPFLQYRSYLKEGGQRKYQTRAECALA